MKRHLAFLIAVSMAAASFTAMPAFAARQEAVNFNDGNANFTGKEDIATEIVEIAEGDKAVKFTSTSSELDQGGSRGLRYNNSANVADVISVFSYDFMIESIESGNKGGLAINLAYNANGWKHAPQVMADHTFGSASWETGKWYTVKYYLDVVNKTLSAGLVDKQTGTETAAIAPRTVDIGTCKGLYNIELHPLINGVMYIDNLEWAYDIPGVVITSPAQGSAINFDEPLDINVALPAGAEKAVLKLNGDLEKELTDVADKESISFTGIQCPAYGELVIEVDAVYADKTLTAKNTYSVNAFEKKNIFAGTPYVASGSDGEYYGGIPAVNNGVHSYLSFLCVQGSDAAKMTFTSEQSGRNLCASNHWTKVTSLVDDAIGPRIPDLKFKDNAITGKIVEWSFKLALEKPEKVSLQVDNYKKGGGYVQPKIISNGVFGGSGAKVEENREYSVAVRYDNAQQTVAVAVDGNKILTVAGAADYTRATMQTTLTGKDSSIKISDMSMDFVQPFSDVSGLSSTVGGKEIPQSDWTDGKVKPIADSVSVKFADTVSAAAGSSIAELFKVDGGEKTPVNITEAISGNKLTITPADGFEAYCDYMIYMYDLKVGSREYAYPLVYCFKTGAADFDVISPADGQTFLNKDITVQLISPDAAPTITVDGTAIAAKNLGKDVYEAVIGFSDINLGMHEIGIVSGENTRTLEVETYSFIGEGQDNDWFIQQPSKGGTITRCTGSDGTENQGIQFTGAGFINMQKSVTAIPASDSLTVAFDIKRMTSDASFDLEAKASGWIWVGGNPLITADGTVNGTDRKLPVGEWHNIRITQELTNNGVCSVWLDGELIKSAASGSNFAGLIQMKFQAKSGTIALDNLFYNETANYAFSPRLSGVSYDLGSGAATYADNRTISASAKSIILDMTEEFDAITADDVMLTDEDGNSINVAAVAKDGKRVIITPAAALPKDKAITVEFDGGYLQVKGFDLGLSLDVKLFSKDDSDKLNDFHIAKADGNVTAHLDLIKGKATTLPENVEIYLAVYENGSLVSATVTKAALTEGENNLATKTLAASENATFKAFLWEANSMNPIAVTEIVK